ncbi:polysaccharide biosynthesis/export family protein [Novosphingobium sp.]|uniref:polysaccharide biosynthesis/export family protein n=1 Tax=Novosphingobium sp. TaxID=1874826 RepID=UPI00333F4229
MNSNVFRFRHIALATVFLLGACAHAVRVGGDPSITPVEGNALPVPTRQDGSPQERPYLLGPFDKLEISVFGVPELAKIDVQVDASGRVSFPLVGMVAVSGQTPHEVELALADGLKKAYIRNPQVTVNVLETLSQYVTVDGVVNKPGLYPVIGHMTLLRAIATASGTTEFSRLDDVVIFRTVAGKQYAALYNLKDVRHGAYPDPEIFANDVVVVGDNHARRLFKDYLTTGSLLAGPLILLLRK